MHRLLAVALALGLAPAARAEERPLLDRVLELATHDHDPDHVDGPSLVLAAFSAWARADPRLEVRADSLGAPTRLDLRAPGGTARLELNGIHNLERAAAAMRAGIARVEALGLPLGSSEPRLIDGMLAALDPHSALLPPGSVGDGSADVGLHLALAGGRAMVAAVEPGSPAARAGVKPGAVLTAVEGEPTLGLAVDRVADRLRGAAGSSIRVELDGRPVALARAVEPTPAVSSARFEGVGYVRLRRFSAGSARSLAAAVEELQKGGASSLVLDLRGNPGGLVDEAVQVADVFLERGLVVETVGLAGSMREGRWAMPGSVSLPLVVLVDGDTASAAEIVAGALTMHGRAALAGDRTYGKGTVQVLYELPGGYGLKLTVAEYRLDGGTSIRRRGLVPDAVMHGVRVLGDETVGFAPADLEGMPPPPGPVVLLSGEGPAHDALLQAALVALAGKAAGIDALRSKLRAAVAAAAPTEEARLGRALHGVDWSAGLPARGKLRVNAVTSRGPGGRIDVTVTVTNPGPAAARLRIWTRSRFLPLDRREIALGRMGAGAALERTMRFSLPPGPQPARVPLELHVDDDAGEVASRDLSLEIPGPLSAGH